MQKIKKLIQYLIFSFGSCLVVFCFFEGLCSLYLRIDGIRKTGNLIQVSHVKYDPLLGWVNLPNMHLKDLFGKQEHLTTNSQGFRNKQTITNEVSSHKIRIICSGDSFTMGFGVGDDETWCHQLQTQDSRLETVNMGQGGYGVDQAYLWYKRDAQNIEHHIHLFAFIWADFRRMQGDNFGNYPKPVLGIKNNKLEVMNYPVPYDPLAKYKDKFRGINDLSLVHLIRNKIGPGRIFRNLKQKLNKPTEKKEQESVQANLMRFDPSQNDSEAEFLNVSHQIVQKMLEDLIALNQSKKSEFVLVQLPTPDNDNNNLVWRRFLKEEAKKKGILYIDFLEAFKHIPSNELDSYFKMGHYSPKGNIWAAEQIYKGLLSYPKTEKILRRDIS